ncbi:hypothetical protein EDB92DRAFT_1945074 [Lactarius akahatsu]|uniref:Uncharacterized protein n=1 Tax=Lactarius akahatsu TaxID=416441 RepID=A0AAD4QED1_9AGAM|nr:hypothetical protein EDB92DRAFT_1945074 [Lactarius akahatsu]
MSLRASRPLSPAVLSTLALPNKRPPTPPVTTPQPLIDLFADTDNNNLLVTYPPLSPTSPLSLLSRIEDDTTLNEGVKTSSALVSTSQSNPPSRDQKPTTTDSAEAPTYDGILQHLKFCYHPQAKEPEFPLLPFNNPTFDATLRPLKKYQPIDMAKTKGL